MAESARNFTVITRLYAALLENVVVYVVAPGNVTVTLPVEFQPPM